MAAFASNANITFSDTALWGAGWWLVVLAILNSAVGVGLACTNAASRVMYTMGRAGTLPASFGGIHRIHRTPTFASAFAQIAGMAAILFCLSPSANERRSFVLQGDKWVRASGVDGWRQHGGQRNQQDA